jgi:sulfhydrogenase subunit beta (sulfur reductase)
MKLLDTNKLTDLAAALAAGGYRVVAPVEVAVSTSSGRPEREIRLAEWTPGTAIRLDGVPANSAKEFLFPRSEVIGRYKLDGNEFQPVEVKPAAPKTVVLGARPCDAASLALMDTVFNWDYKDEFYNARRAATTIVTVVCTTADEHCFCTSVGGRPDATSGADAVLRPADGGRKLILEPLGDKGAALMAAAGKLLADGQAKADAPVAVPLKFDVDTVKAWLGGNFESNLWDTLSAACLGCGACAYACPTCHCFDIQDEATRTESVRLKNWDSCGFGLFTQHAGGHNPRANQAARWRQRVMHKFSYIPERFHLLGCTGCGRCARLCGAGMSMLEVCREIARFEKTEKAVAK